VLTLLEGIRVVDVSRWHAGAVATSLLADLGADVIMLERPPHGNMLRELSPAGSDVPYAIDLTRNKRSVAIDIGSAAHRPVFDALLRSADVFFEASRPGVMRRLGADYDVVRTLRADIVYCSLTAWGQTGPYRNLPAHALAVEAASGLAEILEDAAGGLVSRRRRVAPTPIPTAAGHAAAGILAALVRRLRTGAGTYVDVSLWDTAVTALGRTPVTTALNGGHVDAGYERRGPLQAPYRAADGRIVFADFAERAFWLRFCDVIDRPDLRGLADLAAGTDPRDDEAGRLLSEIFAARPARAWIDLAVDRRLPIAPLLTHEQLPDDPHARARSVFADTTDPARGATRVVGAPIRTAGEQWEASAPPALGRDTVAVLAELGFPANALADPAV
jgi:crotonobetainyl-CoA:carnitine CoA-transferase CaiB-like acyl-CoA transferase